jgi:malonyl-CoA O-methyltransferase
VTGDRDSEAAIDPASAYALWAPSYEPFAHTPLMRVEERAMRPLLPPLEGASVLDAGCGSGRYLAIAERGGARRLVGVDSSHAMLDRVGAPGAALVLASVEAMPLAGASFDVAICALTLGHVPGLRRAFVELARVTRPGGVLVCSELHPAGASLGWRRTFTAEGRRFAVRTVEHSLDDWLAASRAGGWILEDLVEPVLLAGDVPHGRTADPVALTVPSALVLRLVRSSVPAGEAGA